MSQVESLADQAVSSEGSQPPQTPGNTQGEDALLDSWDGIDDPNDDDISNTSIEISRHAPPSKTDLSTILEEQSFDHDSNGSLLCGNASVLQSRSPRLQSQSMVFNEPSQQSLHSIASHLSNIPKSSPSSRVIDNIEEVEVTSPVQSQSPPAQPSSMIVGEPSAKSLLSISDNLSDGPKVYPASGTYTSLSESQFSSLQSELSVVNEAASSRLNVPNVNMHLSPANSRIVKPEIVASTVEQMNELSFELATLRPGQLLSSSVIYKDMLACAPPDSHVIDPLFINQIFKSMEGRRIKNSLGKHVLRVIVPLYDRPNQHWTVVILDRKDSSAYHFDSSTISGTVIDAEAFDQCMQRLECLEK